MHKGGLNIGISCCFQVKNQRCQPKESNNRKQFRMAKLFSSESLMISQLN